MGTRGYGLARWVVPDPAGDSIFSNVDSGKSGETSGACLPTGTREEAAGEQEERGGAKRGGKKRGCRVTSLRSRVRRRPSRCQIYRRVLDGACPRLLISHHLAGPPCPTHKRLARKLRGSFWEESRVALWRGLTTSRNLRINALQMPFTQLAGARERRCKRSRWCCVVSVVDTKYM